MKLNFMNRIYKIYIRIYVKHGTILHTGPAGIISRFKDEAVFSVDSLGLRPVWKVETESSYIFSSEPGVVSPTKYVAETKTTRPWRKGRLKWNEQDELVLYEYDKYQIQVYNRFKKRIDTTRLSFKFIYP